MTRTHSDAYYRSLGTWSMVVAAIRGYTLYQARATRRFPVVVLEAR
jgi:hypothetical protein